MITQMLNFDRDSKFFYDNSKLLYVLIQIKKSLYLNFLLDSLFTVKSRNTDYNCTLDSDRDASKSFI